MDTVSESKLGGTTRAVFDYPAGFKMKSVREQVDVLRERLLLTGTADEGVVGRLSLPKGADGWSVFCGWQRIAPTYNEAVQKVLDAIRVQRNGKFVNFLDGRLGPECLCSEASSVDFSTKVAARQAGFSFSVVPVQFGRGHRNHSVGKVCEDYLPKHEGGLGLLEVALMILTNPRRFQTTADLWVSCPGDRCNDLGSCNRFDSAPYFHFNGQLLALSSTSVSTVAPYLGSASGFLI